MANLALGLAGAVAGSFVGMPGLGFTIGSAIGGMIGNRGKNTNEERIGSRLISRAVQISSYGVAVPLVYGSLRFSGNMIWLRNNEIDETVTTTTETTRQSKGKSRPTHTVTTTTYHYTARFAVLLCHGPISAVTRIWWNGNLVYDRRAGSAAGHIPVTIYTGTETQLPDPTMVEALGDIPALRGYAYAVFRDIDLEPGGNQIGNWEFEVVHGPVVYPPPENVVPDLGGTTGGLVRDPRTGLMWTVAANTMTVINPQTNQIVSSFPAASGTYNYQSQMVFQPELTVTSFFEGGGDGGGEGGDGGANSGGSTTETIPARIWYSNSGVEPTSYFGVIDADTHEQVALFESVYWLQKHLHWDPALSKIVWFRGQSTGAIGIIDPVTFVQTGIRDAANNPLHDLILDAVFAGEYGYWVLIYEDCTLGLIQVGDLSFSDYLLTSPPWADTIHVNGQIAYDNTRGRIWASFDLGSLPGAGWGYFDLTSLTWVKTFDYGIDGSCLYHPGLDAIITWKDGTEGGYSNAHMMIFNASDGSVRDTLPWPSVSSPYISPADKLELVPEAGNLYVYARDLNDTYRLYITRLATGEGVTIQEIVEDVCDRVGMHPQEVDASALSEDIQGYLIPDQVTGRAAIEGLQQYGHFGGVESDTQLTFPLRSGAPTRTLTDEDLVISPQGEIEAAPKLLTIRRIEETELPREVAITFISRPLHYQQSTHRARRLLTRSENHISVDMQIVMSDAVAKQKSDILLDTAWQERELYTFSVSHEEADLNPLDVVNISLDGDTFEAIIEAMRYTPGGQIEITAKSRSAGSYDSTSDASSSEGGDPDTVPIIGSTNVALVDSPLLIDSHGGMLEAGMYLFVAPFTAEDGAWRGVNVYKSPDSQTWNLWASAVESTPMGIGITPSFEVSYPSYTLINREASLTVRLSNGTLASIPEEELYTGKNAALWGNEIIQFTTATLNGDGSYTLTGLVRGRRGTENWMDHPAKGERFILLRHPVLRISTDPGERNLEFYYHSVSIGQVFRLGTTRAFINSEKGLAPYAPTHITGTWDTPASNDVTVAWMARTRIGAQRLPNGTTIGTGENSESYEVDILSDDGTTVVRTLGPVSVKSAVYLEADQITDFGAVRDWIRVRVHQISAAVGRGFGGQEWLINSDADVYEEDFSGMTTGSPPTGWTSQWTSPISWNVQADSSAIGGKYLAMRDTAISAYAFSPDNSDRVSRRNILFRFRCPGAGGAVTELRAFRIYARASGTYTSLTDTTRRAILFGVSEDLSGWGFWMMTPSSENADTFSPLFTQAITAGEWYWGRVDVQGKKIRARVWKDEVGVVEPSDYALEWADPNIPLQGWVGTGFRDPANDADLDYLRIKYGGGNA